MSCGNSARPRRLPPRSTLRFEDDLRSSLRPQGMSATRSTPTSAAKMSGRRSRLTRRSASRRNEARRAGSRPCGGAELVRSTSPSASHEVSVLLVGVHWCTTRAEIEPSVRGSSCQLRLSRHERQPTFSNPRILSQVAIPRSWTGSSRSHPWPGLRSPSLVAQFQRLENMLGRCRPKARTGGREVDLRDRARDAHATAIRCLCA